METHPLNAQSGVALLEDRPKCWVGEHTVPYESCGFHLCFDDTMKKTLTPSNRSPTPRGFNVAQGDTAFQSSPLYSVEQPQAPSTEGLLKGAAAQLSQALRGGSAQPDAGRPGEWCDLHSPLTSINASWLGGQRPRVTRRAAQGSSVSQTRAGLGGNSGSCSGGR
jgi:hypothetical protein